MSRHLAALSPVVFVLFTACGGDDEPPMPPLKDLPKVTAQIMCADQNLTAALDKCKSKFKDALPAILQAKDQGEALALALSTAGDAESANRDARQAAEAEKARRVQMGTLNATKEQADAISADRDYLAGLQRSYPKQAPPVVAGRSQQLDQLKPDIQIDPACGPTPVQDQNTSCKDDVLTAILMWKSAHKSDDTLAINDPTYRQYLVSKVKDVIQQAASEIQQQQNFSPQQMLQLGGSLQSAFTQALPSLGLSSSERSTVASYLSSPTPTQAQTGNLGATATRSLSDRRLGDGRVQPPSQSVTMLDSDRGAAPPARELVSKDELRRAMPKRR